MIYKTRLYKLKKMLFYHSLTICIFPKGLSKKNILVKNLKLFPILFFFKIDLDIMFDEVLDRVNITFYTMKMSV